MDVEQRAREMKMAMTVEEVARIISGAPFPSKQSLSKARAVVEYMGNRAALTPPEGYLLVPVDTFQDLASDAEEYVRSTEFRPSQIENKLSSVREAHDLLAKRPEVKP